MKLLKFAVGVGTGCAWCGRRLRRDLVSEESLEDETGVEGMGWGALWCWWLWWWGLVDWRREEVEVLEELIWPACPRCCLGCGMGLFFEGVSVGDGEGDGIVAAGLGASETEEEADEGAAEN